MRDAQADVPSAKSLGRNLRSKTRWFTGFCNSHQVSHFATFFIDARAEISVAESRLLLRHGTTRAHRLTGHRRTHTIVYVPWRFERRGSFLCQGRQASPGVGGERARPRGARQHPHPHTQITCSRVALLGSVRQ